MKIFIIGINGFIGSHLAEAILKQTDWELFGFDLSNHNLQSCMTYPHFKFVKGDVMVDKKRIESWIKQCDVILPLAAIANPAIYVENPLKVFELDFESNIEVIRKAFQYHKRIIFPSTSEVYGMSSDTPFNEETSSLVLGPINKPRWIYSCCKQLLDRVITAYGSKGLSYSIFRPFNWVGSRLDNLLTPHQPKTARVVTQFISDILQGKEIILVNGGQQRRSFTDIDDSIDCLLRIIENKNNQAEGKIFNIGNPSNHITIRELAEMLVRLIQSYPKYSAIAQKTKLISVEGEAYYGKGYQDLPDRVPSIENAKRYLNWTPKVGIEEMLKKVLDYYLL